MQTVVSQTIEISAPLGKVFRLWVNAEKRMKLNPGWEVLNIRKLTDGPFGVGCEFKNKVRGATGMIEYISRFVEFEDNKKIVTQCVDLNSDLSWRTSVVFDKTPNGTKVTYVEAIELPGDIDVGREEFNRHVKKWLVSVKRYLEIGEGIPGRFKRFLMDRFWLEWSPSKRNIVKFLILLEAATLAAAMISLGVVGVLTRMGIIGSA